MANTLQAKKRVRQTETRTLRNASQRSAMRTHLKRVLKAIKAGDPALALTEFRTASSLADRLARKGIIHKNKAARHKSRLSIRIQGLLNTQAA